MTNAHTLLSALSDDELLNELRRSVVAERAVTGHLIEVLAEVDARRLYLAEGCSSLFRYCTEVLHLSEHAAYGRITAARVARRVPGVLEALQSGEATLTTVCLIGPHLTAANCGEVLDAVRHKSKREVEQLVATLAPKSDVPATVRKLPARAVPSQREAPGDAVQHPMQLDCVMEAPQRAPLPSTGSAHGTIGLSEVRQPGPAEAHVTETEDAPAVMLPAVALAPARPAIVAPLAPERYKVQFTASRELHDKLRRAQDLLRHAVPDGDVAIVIDRALTMLVEELERRKLATARQPRAQHPRTTESRYIPAAVRRIVWSRDEGRCTFVGAQGRCTERGFLEYHHLIPFAAGGETSADNLALRCRAHNQFEAEKFFGPLFARETRGRYDLDAARSGPSWGCAAQSA
jgi:5-methylcytosine-specific restriction endonuclease McrA